MSEPKTPKNKLPPKTNDQIVEVTLKHVLGGFVLVVVGTATIAGTVIVLKDYSKYKRQEAVITSLSKLIDLVQIKRNLDQPNPEELCTTPSSE